MPFEQLEAAIAEISYEGFEFLLREDDTRPYLQVQCEDTCTNTGEPYTWRSRKWFLSPYMTKSEVVQTALKAVLTCVEHEARERFKYQGEAIYSPHYSVDALWALRQDPLARDRRNGEEEVAG